MESKIYLKYTYIHHQSYHSLIRILLDEVCATCVMIGPKRGLNVMIIQKRKKKKKCPGNGRRGSSSRRTKVRRASSARRKDSVRPLKTEVKEAQKIVEDERSLEQARRHRRIAMIIVGTFIFLLVASVLVVVVTLTHSTFLSPPMGSKELAEHRAQT